MKRHILKIMFAFSLSFLAMALYSIVYNLGFGYSFDDNQKLRLILLFLSSGIFLGLYRIMDLLDKK